MSKISILMCALLLVAGCKSREEPPVQSPGETVASGVLELPQPVRIDPRAREILDGWAQYQSLEERMAVLAEAGDQEEMKLLIEELNQICDQLDENPIPEVFDQPSVRSRFKVVRTYLGKLDAALFYRLDYQQPLFELMESYNALREQFNVITSSTLSPDIFEDE